VQRRYSSHRSKENLFPRFAVFIVAAFAIFALGASSGTLTLAQPRPATDAQTQEPEQAADGQVAFRRITPEMHAKSGASLSKLQPTVRQWVREQARVESQRPTPDTAALEKAIRTRFGKKLPEADVAELEFVILMSSIAPQYNALLHSVEEAKAHTTAERALADAISKIGDDVAPNSAAGEKADTNAPCITSGCRSLAEAATHVSSLTAQTMHPLRYDLPSDFSYAQAQDALALMRRDLNILNLSSGAEQQKLQSAVQRWSQILDIISNAMKTMDEASKSSVQNLK
jgi:hypothetical protein